MRNCYWQIFLTYVRGNKFWTNSLFLFNAFAFLATSLIRFWLGPIPPGQPWPAAWQPLHSIMLNFDTVLSVPFFIAYFGSIGNQFNQQLASPLASLLPNYREPHLCVAAFMTIPLVVFATALASVASGVPLVRLLSLDLAFFALFAWSIYGPSCFGFLLAWTCLCSVAIPTVNHFLGHYLTHGSVPMTSFFLCAATFGLVALTRHVLLRREEMPRSVLDVSPDGRHDRRLLRLLASSNTGLWKRITPSFGLILCGSSLISWST